ncbi:extracellular solute-binding protein [Mucisphaera sp.]|uniref:extracellular solute-binding protein n=1 Tax=Mucisphaera sp. TaxID=2913024 RepID=UPI003D134AEE
MKYLFASLFGLLVVASVLVRASYPDLSSRVTVLYWVTDPAPTRGEQVNRFHRWQMQTEHHMEVVVGSVDEAAALREEIPETLVDDVVAVQPGVADVFDGSVVASSLPVTVRLPLAEVRLDTASRDDTKQKIQAVSGVAADIMDVFNGSSMRMFVEMGVLLDVTERAKEMGFDLSRTYAALEPELLVDGRQYMFPGNVSSSFLTVNVDLFRSLGMDPPPERWDFETFERIGVAFCERANEGLQRREVFFLNKIDWVRMHRGLGLSRFNETMTASVLDDPRYASSLERGRRWMYDLNIVPTPDDIDAFSSAQAYGGADLPMFGAGKYGMIEGGRYWLLQLRHFEQLGELGFAEPPHGGFANTSIGTRGAIVYKDTDHPELATLFLAYLASEAYNQLIVEDADALPPNPAFTRTEAYLRPEAYPNEWGLHGPAARIAETIAIGDEYSPFVLPTVVEQEIKDFRDRYLAGMISAEVAAERTEATLNREIAKRVERDPGLRASYERGLALQAEIDALKAEGRPIPAAWVSNPFLRAYYRSLGKLHESDGEGDSL